MKRDAELLARGAEKYGENNWMLANSEEELTRFKASAFRHFMQWIDGEVDEDHAAAARFNITAAEYLKAKLHEKKQVTESGQTAYIALTKETVGGVQTDN